jgi:hypothetical protein
MFVAVETVEEKSIGPCDVLDGGHSALASFLLSKVVGRFA